MVKLGKLVHFPFFFFCVLGYIDALSMAASEGFICPFMVRLGKLVNSTYSECITRFWVS
jgi:hypothetical protein